MQRMVLSFCRLGTRGCGSASAIDVESRPLAAVPAYKSFKAIESGKPEDMASTLQLWGTLALLQLGEAGVSSDVKRSNYYPHLKLALLAYIFYKESDTLTSLWR